MLTSRLIATSMAAAALLAGPASGDEQTVDVRPTRPSEVRLDVEKTEGGKAAQDQASRPVRRRTPTDKPTHIVDVELRVNAETGGRCAYVFMTQGDPASAQARVNEQMAIDLATE